MKFCPNCGAQVGTNDKFCTNCGATLENTIRVQPKKTPVEKTRVRQGQLQPKGVTQSNLSSNKVPMTIRNKKFNPKFLIVAVVVILAIGGLGFYKYRTSPAHNPNNPLANQTITFKQYDSKFVYLSEGTFKQVMHNLIRKMISRYHLNPKATNDIMHINVMSTNPTSEDIKFGKKLKEDTTPVEKKRLDLVGKDVYALLDGVSGKIVKITPSKNLKNGEKVTLKLNINPKIATKYGIDLTPRTVKVQGLNK